MAIDTEKKRKSIVSIGFMPIGPGLVIDGTIDVEDRQAIGYSYAAVLETISTPVSRICLTDVFGSIAKATITGSTASADLHGGCL